MVNRTVRSLALALLLAMVAGCAHTASVIDRSETRTIFRKLALEQSSNFKVLLGGAVREVPIKDVRIIKIDPAESIVFERELYFSAELVLRDGSVLSQGGAAETDGKCYLCINNTLVGKRRGETFRIPLEKVVQIKFEEE
jgi:hypothetical protein